MKAALLAFVFFPSILFAQIPQPPIQIRQNGPRVIQPGQPESESPALPDNYRITLTIADKDTPPLELSIVTASPRFNASFVEQNLSLIGTLTLEDSGNAALAYSIGWETLITVNNTSQYRSSSAQASVHLKLGEPVQIIRAGTRITTLSIEKLAGEKSK